MKRPLTLLCLTVLLSTDVAWTCDTDFDCEVGSRCVGSVCLGGLWPGNDNDEAPLLGRDRPYWDINETYGNTCQFDVDCGPGMRCAKGGSIEGACVPRR